MKFKIIISLACAYSAIVSTIILCLYFPEDTDVKPDYMGIIVAILGILVTVLITWQIWNAINANELIKNTNQTIRRITENVTDNVDALSMAYSLYHTSQIFHTTKDLDKRINALFHCLEYANKARPDTPLLLALNELRKIFIEDKHIIKKSERTKEYLGILSSIKNDIAKELHDYIFNTM